ncbi:tryptophan-rich sensory protein [Paenibacillus psychroresistens]|uniref:Tryptophan-rich sensory protein n=1 Tax=Paenibacillus psychroresistens TaxID=1778678 RepID=A0A6B8RUA1_9BACL|nr:tryptophan-rich sensory protein [Paenibacillus psychroresistens]QGQ99517.1 tryptophan-rich sensory protein [Paenibacillus psychroresistens]
MKLGYRWLNLLAYIAVVGTNGAAISLPLFGRSTKEISDSYPVAVTPAGYAFSIWSLIYILLAGFVILQFIPKERNRSEFSRIGPWFVISSAFNVTWLLLWHSLHITTTAFIMIAMLISLIIIYQESRVAGPGSNMGARLFIALPFSIYLGWISMATIVNVSVALYSVGWDGWGLSPQAWGIVLLIAAGLLAVSIGINYRDPFYALVIIWAAIAIALKQFESYPQLGYAALGIAFILAGFILIKGFQFRNGWVY